VVASSYRANSTLQNLVIKVKPISPLERHYRPNAPVAAPVTNAPELYFPLCGYTFSDIPHLGLPGDAGTVALRMFAHHPEAELDRFQINNHFILQNLHLYRHDCLVVTAK